MGLRTSKVLKIFSILLFSFGLVAPAVLNDVVIETNPPANQQLLVPGAVHSNIVCQLFFEETSGEEEREVKDHKLPSLLLSIDFVAIFAATPPPSPSGGYRSFPIQKLTAQASLLELYCTRLI